jgi:uncharacterized membrane protein YtjA (UPF0391 family)
MLSWTQVFLIVALIAGLLRFTGIAGAAAGIAQTLFIIFAVLFLVAVIAGRRRVSRSILYREDNEGFGSPESRR